MTALSFRVKYKQSISRVLYRWRGDNHLSRACVATRLKRRYPEGRRAASTLPYLVLLRVGFVKPDSHLPAGTLLPHLSTLARENAGGFLFYDTFPGVAPAGRYPAHCPAEPGLSSSAIRQPRLSRLLILTVFILALSPQAVKETKSRRKNANFGQMAFPCRILSRIIRTNKSNFDFWKTFQKRRLHHEHPAYRR